MFQDDSMTCGGIKWCVHLVSADARIKYSFHHTYGNMAVSFTRDILLMLPKPHALLGTCPSSQGINPSFSTAHSLQLVAVEWTSTSSSPPVCITHVPLRSRTENKHHRSFKSYALLVVSSGSQIPCSTPTEFNLRFLTYATGRGWVSSFKNAILHEELGMFSENANRPWTTCRDT